MRQEETDGNTADTNHRESDKEGSRRNTKHERQETDKMKQDRARHGNRNVDLTRNTGQQEHQENIINTVFQTKCFH